MRRALHILRTLQPDARLEAIAQTIGIASDAEREHLAVELIEVAALPRPGAKHPPKSGFFPLRSWIGTHPEAGIATASSALLHLARVWDCLSPDARATALAVGQGRWRLAAEAAALHPSPAARRSAALLARDLAEPSLGPLVAGLVADPVPAVADAAEAALMALAEHAATSPTPDPALALIGDAVAALLASYDRHRRRGVLLATAWLLDARGVGQRAPAPLLRAWFERPDDPAHLALRSLVRRGPEPFLLDRAWTWLASPAIYRPSLDRVASAGADDLPRLIRRSHLLAHPRRAALLRTVRPGRPIQAGARAPHPLVPRDPAALTTEARRGLPRWIAALDLQDAEREQALSPLLADTDPVTRHAAARTAPPAALADFAFDSEEPIARLAVLRLLGTGDALPSALNRSPHASVRAIAAEECDGADPWRPRSPRSRLAARRLLASDRAAFLGRLRQRIADGPAHERTDAILLASALGVAPAAELELLAAVRELDHLPADEALARPAAAAITALGRVPTDSARAAVLACLAHPHDRIRANAVESAAHHRPSAEAPLASRLVELAADPHHRVRANALRALLALGDPDGSEAALADMLSDARAMHRVAGLWLLERTLPAPADAPSARRWSALAARVAEIARTDRDPAASARAVNLSRRLLRQMRAGWQGRARPLAARAREEVAP